MALAARAGIFAHATTSISGLGFRPSTILLWTVNTTADGVISGGEDVSFGFWSRSSSTVAPRAQSLWISADNGIATSSVDTGLDPAKPISNQSWNVSSITDTADGFTLVYGGTVPAGTRIGYLALGSEALSDILTFTVAPGVTVGSIIKVRGARFTPSSVILTGIHPTTTGTGLHKGIGFGVADSVAGQWSGCWASRDDQGIAATGTGWTETHVFQMVNGAGTPLFKAKLVGYEADGFNLEVITAPTTTVAIYALCLANIETRVQMHGKTSTTVGAVETLPAIPFTPVASVLSMAWSATPEQTHLGSRGSIGASTGTSPTQAHGEWIDTNAADTMASAGYTTTGQAVGALSSSTVNASRAGHSYSGKQSVLTWPVNSTALYRIGLLHFGSIGTPLGGQAYVPVESVTEKWTKPILLLGSNADVATIAETAGLFQYAVIGGDAVVETLADGAIKLLAKLGGAALVDTAATGSLKLSHTLGGQALVDTLAEGRIVIPIRLFGESVVETLVEARIALKHRLGGSSLVDIIAESYFTLELPIVRPALPNEYPGTINLHFNPGAEDGVNGWSGYGGGVIDEDVLTVWEGARSVEVTTTSGSAGQGVMITSATGTDLTGLNERGIERVMWGSMYGAGNNVPIETWSRAVYTDGTETVGDHDTEITLHPAQDWQRIIAPPITLDPAKKLSRIETFAVTAVPTAGVWYVDGAQVEEERGVGASSWTSGAYGQEIGTWNGPPDRAVSIRQPLVINTQTYGQGGQVEIEVRLYRATFDNKFVEDITDAVIQGSVSADPDRDVTWAFDATLTIDGWRKLEPLYDWVAPYVIIRYPDGSTKEGQLGLYYVVPSDSEYEEHRGTVKLSAFDPLWLIARQGLTGNLVALPGADRGKVLRALIDGAAITGGMNERPGVPRRYFIPDANKDFKKKREWEKDQDRLQICNDIANSCGFFPLWTTQTGFITTRKRGEGRMKERTPVRSWAANVPGGFVPNIHIPNLAKLGHEVIGRVPTVPKARDLYDEILIYNDDPDLGRIYVKGRIVTRGGKHYRVVDRKHGRSRLRRLRLPYLDDQATATDLVRALTDELSVKTEYITLRTIIDPSINLMRGTVTTAIWDLDNNPVAVGHWMVGRVSYALWPNTPTMTMELSRINYGADDIDVETS